MKKWELVNFCEFDKHAAESYCAIHGVDESLNLGDVTTVDENNIAKFNMIVGGSPCQDFSIAGKQKGSVWKCVDCGEEYNPLQVHWDKRDYCPKCSSENLDKTRSSLLVEWLRVIRGNKPNFGIYENVKNIVGKQFKDTTFKIFEEELNEYGYNTYWKVLNAKNYGVPQNRERVFLILIKKDLDNGKFKFPKEFDGGLRLKDLLENDVEDKYYINNDRVEKLLQELKEKDLLNGERFGADSTINDPQKRDISNCITARYDAGIQNQKQIGMVVAEPNSIICAERGRYNDNGEIEQQLEIQESGNSNTLTSVQKDNLVLEQNMLRYERTEYGKAVRKQYENGEVEEKIGNMRELKPREDDISNTLTTVQKDNLLLEKIVCEQRTDEGLRFFKDDVCGTIRTIDSGGDKRVIEKTNELQLFTNLSGGKWDKIHESSRRVYDESGIAPTIPTCQGGNIEPKVHTQYKIRKLTPKECFRLMGFDDKDFERVKYYTKKESEEFLEKYPNSKSKKRQFELEERIERMSNSQLYKQAGNSIVVDVLYEIYKELYIAMPYLFDDLKLSSFFSGIGAFEKALDRLYEDINNDVNFTKPQAE